MQRYIKTGQRFKCHFFKGRGPMVNLIEIKHFFWNFIHPLHPVLWRSHAVSLCFALSVCLCVWTRLELSFVQKYAPGTKGIYVTFTGRGTACKWSLSEEVNKWIQKLDLSGGGMFQSLLPFTQTGHLAHRITALRIENTLEYRHDAYEQHI